MIPILHIIDFMSFLFCVFASRKLYGSYRKSKGTVHLDIGDFFRAYVSLAAYFLIMSSVAIVDDPVKVQIMYIFSFIAGILSPAFLVHILLRGSGKGKYIPYYRVFVVSSLAVITLINILTFAPARKMIYLYGSVFHWTQGTPLSIRFFTGVFLAILATSCALLFLNESRKSHTEGIKTRALFMGTGLLFAVTGSTAYYSVSIFFIGTVHFFLIAFAVSGALLGVVTMLVGIYHKTDI